jgi:hypothetical protein
MSRRRITRQRGGVGGKLGNMGAFGALFARRGGPPNAPPANAPPANAPPANAPPANAPVVNDPLLKYRRMQKMGQPEGAIIQKMLANGKNPKNIFPGYGAPAPVVKEGFTLEELRDLKDYVNRSEIVVRLNKLGINPNELYPEITPEEIAAIVEDYSKPSVGPVAALVVKNGEPKNMQSALLAAAKRRQPPPDAVEENIERYKEFTPQEEEDLNSLDAARKRIKTIETESIPFTRKQIEKLEKTHSVKDFNLRIILDLLKEKRNLESTILRLDTALLKNKYNFSKKGSGTLSMLEDKDGPLPRGWNFVVDQRTEALGTTYYQNKYNPMDGTIIRPTEEAYPPELPEGWKLYENEIDAWYVNTLTGKAYWDFPTSPADDPLVSSGWEKYLDKNGTYIWAQDLNASRKYNTDNKWYRLRNKNDNLWFENSSRDNNKRFNKPPNLGQPDNVTSSWKRL